MRVFDAVQREEALRWLEALPGRLATTRTDPAAGVVVADVGQPLRREDVEVVATAVDSWLADHTDCPGWSCRPHRSPAGRTSAPSWSACASWAATLAG